MAVAAGNKHIVTCYYKILSVSIRASQEEIKSAFRLLALRWHPDRNSRDKQAAERFREALEAYETLGDPARRRQYDRLNGYKSSKSSSNNTRGPVRKDEQEASLHDMVEEAFGIRFEHLRERPTYDLRFDLQVSNDAARAGTYESIEYRRWVFCEGCLGRGARNGSGGCEACNGSGGVEEDCSIRVWIPAGSEDGSRLRVSGAGDRPEPGCRAGDLVVLVQIVD